MGQLLEQTIIQLLDLGGGIHAAALNPGAFDIAPDYFPHFARIKRLADVIVRAQAQRLLGRLERAETGQHDHGNMRIDLADFA